MTGLNEGAPWQPGSGSLCSGENAGFVSFPIVEYLKGPEPESGHASGSHGPCLVEVLGRSAQEGCHGGVRYVVWLPGPASQDLDAAKSSTSSVSASPKR